MIQWSHPLLGETLHWPQSRNYTWTPPASLLCSSPRHTTRDPGCHQHSPGTHLHLSSRMRDWTQLFWSLQPPGLRESGGWQCSTLWCEADLPSCSNLDPDPWPQHTWNMKLWWSWSWQWSVSPVWMQSHALDIFSVTQIVSLGLFFTVVEHHNTRDKVQHFSWR